MKLNLVRHGAGKEEEEKSRALTAATKELFIHASTLKSKVLFDLKKAIFGGALMKIKMAKQP